MVLIWIETDALHVNAYLIQIQRKLYLLRIYSKYEIFKYLIIDISNMKPCYEKLRSDSVTVYFGHDEIKYPQCNEQRPKEYKPKMCNNEGLEYLKIFLIIV